MGATVTQLEPTRHARRDGAEAPMHPLPEGETVWLIVSTSFGG